MISLLTWRKRLTVPRRNLCVQTCAEVSCAFLQRAIVRAVEIECYVSFSMFVVQDINYLRHTLMLFFLESWLHT